MDEFAIRFESPPLKSMRVVLPPEVRVQFILAAGRRRHLTRSTTSWREVRCKNCRENPERFQNKAPMAGLYVHILSTLVDCFRKRFEPRTRGSLSGKTHLTWQHPVVLNVSFKNEQGMARYKSFDEQIPTQRSRDLKTFGWVRYQLRLQPSAALQVAFCGTWGRCTAALKPEHGVSRLLWDCKLINYRPHLNIIL